MVHASLGGRTSCVIPPCLPWFTWLGTGAAFSCQFAPGRACDR